MGQRSPGMGELTQLWGRGISSDVGHGRAEGGGEVGVGLRGLQVGAEGAFHSGRPKKGAGGWTPPHPQHPQAGEGGCAPHCSQQRAQILQPGCRGTAPGHQQKIRTPPPPRPALQRVPELQRSTPYFGWPSDAADPAQDRGSHLGSAVRTTALQGAAEPIAVKARRDPEVSFPSVTATTGAAPARRG